MFKTQKILGFCLILAALCAPNAHAAAIFSDSVDPGGVGDPANELFFFVPPPGAVGVELMFTDNKTLEYGPGIHVFFVTGGNTGPRYVGAFLDASGNYIPGTQFLGNVDVNTAQVNLSETTVFSGILFLGVPFDGSYGLLWVGDAPTVGVVPCDGDFDMDGDVDGTDLAVFAADFGRTDCTPSNPCNGDFDNDGDVDGTDLARFAASFGRTDCPIPAAP